jgi:hypothetical protein
VEPSQNVAWPRPFGTELDGRRNGGNHARGKWLERNSAMLQEIDVYDGVQASHTGGL